MADINILAPFILSFEGGFSNHPADKGGATNKGVTLKTWQSVGYDKNGDGRIDVQDLKLITEKDAVERVLKPYYWDKVQGDKIHNQSIANLLADWVWGSGTGVIRNVQRLFGLKQDGIVGPKTLAALNSGNHKFVFDQIMAERNSFLNRIVNNNPSQKVFLNGWKRRLSSIGFGWLKLNDSKGTVIHHL